MISPPTYASSVDSMNRPVLAQYQANQARPQASGTPAAHRRRRFVDCASDVRVTSAQNREQAASIFAGSRAGDEATAGFESRRSRTGRGTGVLQSSPACCTTVTRQSPTSINAMPSGSRPVVLPSQTAGNYRQEDKGPKPEGLGATRPAFHSARAVYGFGLVKRTLDASGESKAPPSHAMILQCTCRRVEA